MNDPFGTTREPPDELSALERRILALEQSEAVYKRELEFEQLISDLSSKFVSIPPERVDSEIVRALRRICGFTRCDRCALFAVLHEKGVWRITHFAAVEDAPSVPVGLELPVTMHPWVFDTLLNRREILSFSRLDELPAEADRDRRTYAEWGTKSSLDIPIFVEGAVDHVISVSTTGTEREWTTELVPKLKLLGETCVDALVRRRGQEELRESERNLLKAQRIAGLGTFTMDMSSKIFKTSDVMDELFGIDDAYDRSLDGWMARVHPDDRDMMTDVILNEAMTRGKNIDREYRIVRANDGTTRWIHSLGDLQFDIRGLNLELHGTCEDITERKRAEEDLRNSNRLLREALTGTVESMAAVVEFRDPYTAGHQKRVAELAEAIAAEMGLPAEQIEGVRMAAFIHDLGKISVPAEILCKPTLLRKPELELLRDHPRAGYDILKDIAFPWPIARIVLEHHEKLDGSGYPNGLSGDDILLESRIVTVADVVESMASHRPYRPSKGLDAAIAEIVGNKGTWYDGAVVDACLRLIREKDFRFLEI